MRVGDYVRINGYITKIKGVSHWKSKDEWYISYDRPDGCESASIVNDKFKISPNIIDLIEVGDYVNGCKVIGRTSENAIMTGCEDMNYFEYSKAEIKSIVTKEMYSSVEYRVEIN